jgi:hypothetical protein
MPDGDPLRDSTPSEAAGVAGAVGATGEAVAVELAGPDAVESRPVDHSDLA